MLDQQLDAGSSDPIAMRLKSEMPLWTDRLYLNMGTLAPTPRSTLAAMERATRDWMGQGPGGPLDPALPAAAGGDAYLRMLGRLDDTRAALAGFLGTDPSSVALLGNATDALHAALLSIPFRPGDRVITTDEEHDALAVPLRLLARRLGFEVVTIPFPLTSRTGDGPDRGREGPAPANPEIILGTPAAGKGPVRLLTLSHVSHRTGEVADLGPWIRGARERGIWTLVDGAHAVGTLENPLGLPETPDFYAFPCHKWLLGPVGTGALIAGKRALAETTPLVGGSPARRPDGSLHPDPGGAWRYEFGTRDWTRQIGLTASLDLLAACGGITALKRHYRQLTEAFVTAIDPWIAWRGHGPLLLVEGPDPDAWALRLWNDERILTKPMDNGLRISLGPWLTTGEVRHAAEQILKRRPG